MEATIKELQEKVEMKNELKTKVSWTIFTWAILLITGVIGYAVNIGMAAQSETNENGMRIADVEGDIKSINTSLQFIQQSLTRIENKIK